jgi:tetratricopeptide (TPR) repeat protein
MHTAGSAFLPWSSPHAPSVRACENAGGTDRLAVISAEPAPIGRISSRPPLVGRRHRWLAVALAATSLLVPAPGAAQGYDPRTGASPLELLSAPKDGIAYHEGRQKARALILARKAAEAEPIAERLVRDYPRDGENWILLATSRRLLGRHAGAAHAYEQAGALLGWAYPSRLGGKNADRPGFHAIASHAAAGNHAAAMALLRQEVRRAGRLGYYHEPEFAALRNDPEFLALVQPPDASGLSRDDGWRADVDFLHDEVARVHPDHQTQPIPAAFTRARDALKARVPQLSDEQMLVELNRMLATLNPYGHTEFVGLRHPASRIRTAVLPVRLYAFADGVFIVNATPAHRALIGARVVAVGDTPIDDALRRASTLVSRDGLLEYPSRAPGYLSSAPLLKGLGIIEDMRSVSLRLAMPGGAERTIAFATLPEQPWDTLAPPDRLVAPITMRAGQEYHRERAMPSHDALYLQVDQLLDDPDETLAQFGRRMWTQITSARPKNLILDLRRNGGGSTHLYPELLRTLIAFGRTPGHQLYVLIGRRSYSATGNLVTDLDRLAEPIFVGEATGQCCHLHGDVEGVTLPYSRITGTISATRWRLSHPWDERLEMPPDVPVALTGADYFAGRDPALDAVLTMIARRRAATAAGS